MRNGGPLKLAGDAPIGQIKTDRQFRIAFVDPITDPHPTAHGTGVVEGVHVHALVEVALGSGAVRKFVARQ